MTTRKPRYVFDTNTLISAALFEGSTPDSAFRWALRHGQVLASPDTLDELVEVLGRDKFDRYLSTEEREAFLEALVERVDVRVGKVRGHTAAVGLVGDLPLERQHVVLRRGDLNVRQQFGSFVHEMVAAAEQVARRPAERCCRGRGWQALLSLIAEPIYSPNGANPMWVGITSCGAPYHQQRFFAMADESSVDRSAFSVSSFAEAEDQAHWLSRTPQERLVASEQMRQINDAYDPVSDRIQCTLEVAER